MGIRLYSKADLTYSNPLFCDSIIIMSLFKKNDSFENFTD